MCHKRNKKIFSNNLNNITEYNEKFPNDYMAYSYIILDEASYFMTDATDDKNLQKEKEQCQDLLKRTGQEGRSCGVQIILCVQRPDQLSLPPTLKQHFNIRIAFRENNDASSLTAIDTTKAVGLPNREAWLLYSGKYAYIKTLYIDDSLMNKYLNPLKEKNKQYLNLDKNGNIVDKSKNNSNSQDKPKGNNNDSNTNNIEDLFVNPNPNRITKIEKPKNPHQRSKHNTKGRESK
jgi:DNA segregation ATPase FtsK/SpoIIIE-like protein